MPQPPTLEPPRFEGALRLRDGRRLGYAEYGPASGRPLLWFHGTPGARRQVAPEARTLARERGVRLVAVERPGIGESTPHLYRTLVEFAADIEQLCDALGVERFAVAGLSGGGPYALACATVVIRVLALARQASMHLRLPRSIEAGRASFDVALFGGFPAQTSLKRQRRSVAHRSGLASVFHGFLAGASGLYGTYDRNAQLQNAQAKEVPGSSSLARQASMHLRLPSWRFGLVYFATPRD